MRRRAGVLRWFFRVVGGGHGRVGRVERGGVHWEDGFRGHSAVEGSSGELLGVHRAREAVSVEVRLATRKTRRIDCGPIIT